MLRLSPVPDILETGNNSGPQKLGVTCRYLDPSATALHKCAITNKNALVNKIPDRLPLETMKLHILPARNMSHYPCSCARLWELHSRLQIITQVLPFKNSEMFAYKTHIQRETNRNPKTALATTAYAKSAHPPTLYLEVHLISCPP